MYSCMEYTPLLQNSRGQQWDFILQWTQCHFIFIKVFELFYYSSYYYIFDFLINFQLFT